MARRRSRRNPLSSGPPPQYVFGGMGTPQLWRYRGRDLEVTPVDFGAWQGFRATWVEPLEEGDRIGATGHDVHDALANARLDIDLYELGDPWRDAYQGLDTVSDTIRGPYDRRTLARQAEIMFRKRLAGEEGAPQFLKKSEAKAFYKLSLPDRLRLMDELIAVHRRKGMIDPNPAGGDLPPPRFSDHRAVVRDLLAW